MPEIGNGFGRLHVILAALTTKGAERIVRAMAREAVSQAKACFRESRNPYGEPWAPLKRRSGKPLIKTGRGRASLAVQNVTATGFRIGTNVGYMHVHQNGFDGAITRKPHLRTLQAAAVAKLVRGGQFRLRIPQRAFLPIRGRGLGLWASPLEKAGLDALAKLIRPTG